MQELRAKIREIMKHHGLTTVGDGVVEGDLLAAFEQHTTSKEVQSPAEAHELDRDEAIRIWRRHCAPFSRTLWEVPPSVVIDAMMAFAKANVQPKSTEPVYRRRTDAEALDCANRLNRSFPPSSLKDEAADHIRELVAVVQAPAPGAASQEVQNAAWRKWADAGTVGSLIAFLATLDPADPIVTAYHVTMGNGERRCKTRSLTISRERVDHAAKTIRTADLSLPYTHVLWAHPPEETQAPAVVDDDFEQERWRDKIMELVDALADESATKAYHGEFHCRRKPKELRALILAELSKPPVQGSQS